MRPAAAWGAALATAAMIGAAGAAQAADPIDNTPQCFLGYAKPGMPQTRGDEARGEQLPPLCRRGYAFVWNKVTRNPDWVMEHLTVADLTGPAKRKPGGFKADDLVGDGKVVPGEYDRTGYDRGHQAPAGDAKSSQPLMDDSFFMTNMAPQVGPKFNRGEWKYLEEQVRAWVLCGGHKEVFVMTGPIYEPGKPARLMLSKDKDPKKPGAEVKVRIPDAFFKIVYDPAMDRAMGFVLDNKAVDKTDFAVFARKIDFIEDQSGLDFFPAFTQRHQKLLEATVKPVWGHTAECKGTATD